MPTFVLSELAYAAFPGSQHPDALVHIPEHIHPTEWGLVVYLHGFDNCIENVAAAPPGIHDPPHPSADLIGQLESSGKSAILFLPETGFHQKSADPGQLGKPQGFAALFCEVQTRIVAEQPSTAHLFGDRLPHVLLLSHSGGYKTAAKIAIAGGLPIAELCLLDSLYGAIEEYDQITATFLVDHTLEKKRRFVNLYREGSTAYHARAQAQRLRDLLLEKNLPAEHLSFDDSDASLDEAALSRLFCIKRVLTEHSDFGRTHFASLLRSSHLPDVKTA